MFKFSTRKIAFSAVVAALYVGLTLASMPIAYGVVQFRISEALCVLPFFFPFSVWGIFAGCIVANLFSPYIFPDIVIGPVASLLAALCTMYIGKMKSNESLAIKAFACFPPVFFNAILIGAMIADLMIGYGDYFGSTIVAVVSGNAEVSNAFFSAFITNMLWVGLGQMVVLYVLGLPLMVYLQKSTLFEKLKALYNNEKGLSNES